MEENALKNQKYLNYGFIILGFIPLFFWCYYYLNIDLWYDEACSFEEFVFVNWQGAALNYPYPNNHVFYNLLFQGITSVFGISDLFEIADNIYVLRSIGLLITCLIAYYSAKIINTFLIEKPTALSYVILFTTIPFMNFSLQLRGYNLSGLFIVILIYYSLSYIKNKSNLSAFLIITSTALLLYTLPSNLYFAVAFGSINVLIWLFYKRNNDAKTSRKYFKVILFLSLGAIICTLLYLPIIKDILTDKYINRGVYNRVDHVLMFWKMNVAYLSNRLLLFFIAIPGLYLYFKRREKKRDFIVLLLMIIMPFVFSILHNKGAFERIFSPLAPVFCIVLTVGIMQVIQYNLSKSKLFLAQLILSLYCIGVFIYEKNQNDSEVTNNLVYNNKLTQNIYQNFYLSPIFQPNNSAIKLKEVYNNNMVFRYKQEDVRATDFYLNKYEIVNTTTKDLNEVEVYLKLNKPFFILTSYKQRTIKKLQEITNRKITVINTDDEAFTNILKIE